MLTQDWWKQSMLPDPQAATTTTCSPTFTTHCCAPGPLPLSRLLHQCHATVVTVLLVKPGAPPVPATAAAALVPGANLAN